MRLRDESNGSHDGRRRFIRNNPSHHDGRVRVDGDE
jgi:hypothetical protein